MKKLFSALIIAVAAACFSACNGKKIYHGFDHTPLAGWEKNDTLLFSVPRLTTGGEYSSDLMLRINETYPFMGLTLIVEQKVIPGGMTYCDTLKCRLMNEKGYSKGQGISYYQYVFHVNEMSLEQGDSLQISIRHDMKREILPGISDVGMKITRR